MNQFTGQLLITIYEHQLRHRRPRTDALVDLCRWSSEHADDGPMFAALLAFAARNSTTAHPLLDAGRAGVGELLDALSNVEVTDWDEAMAAAYDDPAHTMTPGWMAHVLAELDAVAEVSA